MSKYQKKSFLIVSLHLVSIALLFLACSIFLYSNHQMVLQDILNFQIYPYILIAALVINFVDMWNALNRLETKTFYNADRFLWVYKLLYVLVVAIICFKTFLYTPIVSPSIILAVVAGLIKMVTPPIKVHNADDF
ncbi:MAG: hypothetical protein FWD32_02015 [Firmicutes bacterium]|nr:hypothetical protein [Bacillota bacterium]